MARALKDTPWPVLLLIASFLCPTELSLYIGSARLPPHRALLLLLLPVALLSLLGRSRMRPRAFDFAFLGFAVWTVFIYLHHHGQADGLQTGGALALDSLGSFLVARAFVRDERTLRGTAATLLLAVAVTGAIALPETLFGKIFVHDFLRDVTGYVHPTGVEKRLGLTRAFGTFDHPIHLGTFCASSLALAVYAARRETGAFLRAVVIGLAALLSLSSAPMLSLAVQSALVIYERLTRGIAGRVLLAVGAIAALFLAVSAVATRSPFAIIATGFTLDSWTGFYRLMIWENGLANVWANPWLGLGLNDWVRPRWMVSPTVDAFWLVIAMRGGIPAFLLLALGVVLLAIGVAAGMRRADKGARRMATGWMISVIALSLVGCTVHYWNVPFAYFFFFLGLGGAIADPVRGAVRSRSAREHSPLPLPRLQWLAPGEAVARGWAPRGAGAGTAASALATPRWPVPVQARPAAASPETARRTAPIVRR